MDQLPMERRADRESVSERFFRGTANSYDRVARLLSYGLDGRWKRRLMTYVPPDATRILDLACGTGIVLGYLHARAPHAALVGVDFTAEYLDVARRKFRRHRSGCHPDPEQRRDRRVDGDV